MCLITQVLLLLLGMFTLWLPFQDCLLLEQNPHHISLTLFFPPPSFFLPASRDSNSNNNQASWECVVAVVVVVAVGNIWVLVPALCAMVCDDASLALLDQATCPSCWVVHNHGGSW